MSSPTPAPTGCAAKLLPYPNSTLHSLLHLPINQPKSKALPDLSETALKERQLATKHLVLLVIDEKCFIGCRMLYEVDSRLRQIRNRHDTPFGRVSIVLMGDFKTSHCTPWRLPR